MTLSAPSPLTMPVKVAGEVLSSDGSTKIYQTYVREDLVALKECELHKRRISYQELRMDKHQYYAFLVAQSFAQPVEQEMRS